MRQSGSPSRLSGYIFDGPLLVAIYYNIVLLGEDHLVALHGDVVLLLIVHHHVDIDLVVEHKLQLVLLLADPDTDRVILDELLDVSKHGPADDLVILHLAVVGLDIGVSEHHLAVS